MENDKPNETDTPGKEADKPTATTEEPLSIVDEAKKVRDEIKGENDRREEILKKEQKLASDKVLSGTSGGHVEAKTEDPAQKMADEITGAFK